MGPFYFLGKINEGGTPCMPKSISSMKPLEDDCRRARTGRSVMTSSLNNWGDGLGEGEELSRRKAPQVPAALAPLPLPYAKAQKSQSQPYAGRRTFQANTKLGDHDARHCLSCPWARHLRGTDGLCLWLRPALGGGYERTRHRPRVCDRPRRLPHLHAAFPRALLTRNNGDYR